MRPRLELDILTILFVVCVVVVSWLVINVLPAPLVQ